jgi:hypothetical protein
MTKLEITDMFGSSPGADLDELAMRAARRDSEGNNQLEVARVGERYPMLAVYFHDEYAVIFRIDREGGEVHVLMGDASVANDKVLHFRGLVGYEEFTGEVIVKASTALQCLHLFATNSAWPPDLSWITQ